MNPLMVLVGVALLGFGLYQWQRRWRIADTPTSDAAHVFPGRNELHGEIRTDVEPIVSPVTGRRFVWWAYELERQVSNGKTTSWQQVEAGEAWVRCWLHDASGRVMVLPERGSLRGDVDDSWQDSLLLGTRLPDVTLDQLRARARPEREYEGGFLDQLLGDDPSDVPLPDLRGTFRLTERGLSIGAQVFGDGEGSWDERHRQVVVRHPSLRPGDEAGALGRAGGLAGLGVAGGAALVTVAPVVGDTAVSPLWCLATGAAAAAVIAGSWLVRIFNRVVRARTQRDKARSMEEVELHRRADLVPQLTEVVRAAFAHERELLVLLTGARTDAAAGDLAPLVARLEATPALGSHEVAARLRDELVRCEDRLAFARRFLVDAEQVLADRTAMAPDRWIARLVVRADPARRPLGAGVGPPG